MDSGARAERIICTIRINKLPFCRNIVSVRNRVLIGWEVAGRGDLLFVYSKNAAIDAHILPATAFSLVMR